MRASDGNTVSKIYEYDQFSLYLLAVANIIRLCKDLFFLSVLLHVQPVGQLHGEGSAGVIQQRVQGANGVGGPL